MRRMAVIGVLVLALAACGGGDDGDAGAPASTTARPAATSTTTNATTTSANEVGGRVALPGPLEAGEYTTGSGTTSVTYTLGDGWRFLGGEDGIFALARVDDVDSQMAFVHVRDVVRDGQVQPVPSDLIAWLRESEDLDVGPAGTMDIDGRPATYVDVTMKASSTATRDGCPTPCVELFRFSSAFVYIGSGVHTRWYVVPDVGGAPLVVQAEAPEAKVQQHLAVVEAVLKTVALGTTA
jgi:hypothetical protein